MRGDKRGSSRSRGRAVHRGRGRGNPTRGRGNARGARGRVRGSVSSRGSVPSRGRSRGSRRSRGRGRARGAKQISLSPPINNSEVQRDNNTPLILPPASEAENNDVASATSRSESDRTTSPACIAIQREHADAETMELNQKREAEDITTNHEAKPSALLEKQSEQEDSEKIELDEKQSKVQDIHSWILSGLHCDIGDMPAVRDEILALTSKLTGKVKIDAEMRQDMRMFSVKTKEYVLTFAMLGSLPEKEFRAFVELLHFLDSNGRHVEEFLLSMLPFLAAKLN